MAYRLLVSIDVTGFIERLSVKTREALRSAIHSIARDPLVWRAGLFREAGIKMVRGDLMRGSGMVRRMGGVLIRESSRGTAEKLPRINSAGLTG